jgi:KamA family protein
LRPVTEAFDFRANDYYLGLINWDDPEDPIRRIIIPDLRELDEYGTVDASNESSNYVAPGVQHKYPDTALVLANEVCGGYCRYCFRKRIFAKDSDEVAEDLNEGLEYIRKTPGITNVLLTGGDPLLLSTPRLEKLVRAVREIDHVQVIRIGSKLTAFNPYRIINDPELPAMLSRYSTKEKRIYIVCHFDVVQELTDVACQGLDILMKAGVVPLNQTPIVNGVNDTVEAMSALFLRLSAVGIPPYYIFQCRPTQGNRPYSVPITRAYRVIEEARSKVSGLARRARYVMSHASGKIEMVGLTEQHIFMRYHRARDREDYGRFLICLRNDEAHWLNDLTLLDELQIGGRQALPRPTDIM